MLIRIFKKNNCQLGLLTGWTRCEWAIQQGLQPVCNRSHSND